MASASQEVIQLAMAELPVGVAIVREGRFVFVNAAFCSMVGHPEAVLLEKDPFAFVVPEDVEAVRARHLARQSGAPVPPQYEVTLLDEQGNRRRLELEPRVLSQTDTLLVLRLVGERAQDRELLTALGALQARVQGQRSVSGVLEVAVAGLLELGFDACVGQLMGEECVMVAHAFHPEVDRLAKLIFQQGPRGPVIPTQRIPVTEAAIHLGQPFFRDDASDALARLATRAGVSPEEVARIRKQVQPLQATISPLTVRGRGWGVLMGLASGLRANDAAALALFASQVSSSIEMAQSIENLEAIHQVAMFGAELSHEALVDRLLPLLSRATQSDVAGIYLLSADGGSLELAGASAPSRAARAHTRIAIPSLEGGPNAFRAQAFSTTELAPPFQALMRELGCEGYAQVPLAVNGRLGGMLYLCRKSALPFSEEDLRSAEMLAAQVALQLERVRLYGEARRRVEELSLVNDLGAAIAQLRNMDEVFAVAVRHVAKIVRVSNAFLMLLDESGTRLKLAATNADNPDLMRLELPLEGNSAAADAVRNLAPVVIPDVSLERREERKLGERYGQRALLAIPLLSHGTALGVLVLGDTNGPRRFSVDEMERSVEVANQLAAAIANARLFGDLNRSYQELRRTQEELVKRERLAALGELSALVAHEVRNPLGVIFNSLSSLKRNPVPGDEQGRQLLRVVEEEAERLNRMVNDLLDFAGPASARVRKERLELVISGALEAAVSAVPASHVTLELKLPPDLPAVPVDAQMLRQAVVNLVVNAIQAMPSGGTVQVRAAVQARPQGGNVARLDVCDNGPGMSEAVAARAFEPFFTTRAAGTGLGLAVVKRIAEAHGGEVAIETTPGQGATFSLLLPL